MTALAIIVVSVTILANLIIVVGDIAKAKFVVDNSRSVGVPDSWLPALALLKSAGALGLLLGLLDVPFVGIAAAIGLVLFYGAALVAHLRARVFTTMVYPGLFFALAVACVVGFVTS